MGTGILATVVAAMVSAAALAPAGPAPAYRGDFADPAVITVGRTYWAYGTGSAGRNLQVMASPDLRHWGPVHDPLPHLPSWATPGFTWAPGVIQRGGTFVMYYTVRYAAANRECVSEATSSSPAGPFVDVSTRPLVCQLEHGGAIDPSPYVDPHGQPYLLWKSDDDAIGEPTHLWGQALSGDGRRLIGTAHDLLMESQAWQEPSVEGPAMVSNGGLYYLFYGANRWGTKASGIGYAVCTDVLGPCVNSSLSGPWYGTSGAVVGPQGPSVFTAADGTTKLVFAAWNGPVRYDRGGVRSAWVGTLVWELGGPVVR